MAMGYRGHQWLNVSEYSHAVSWVSRSHPWFSLGYVEVKYGVVKGMW